MRKVTHEQGFPEALETDAPTRRKEASNGHCHLQNVFQAICTGGMVIPNPVLTCRYVRYLSTPPPGPSYHQYSYNHRVISVQKLVDVGFTHVLQNMALGRMMRLQRLKKGPHARFEAKSLHEVRVP